jgi:hypothetical protein
VDLITEVHAAELSVAVHLPLALTVATQPTQQHRAKQHNNTASAFSILDNDCRSRACRAVRLSDPGGSVEKRRCVSFCSRVTVACQSEKRPEAEDEDEEDVVEDEDEVRVLREEVEEWEGDTEEEVEVIVSSSPSNDSGEGSCSAMGTGMEQRQDATTPAVTKTMTSQAER